MLMRYVDKAFRPETLEAIDRANAIIEEYRAQGLSLTLRQLYYQHVARGLIENTDPSYNRLQSMISDARLAGLVSWTAIEDRTRNLMGLTTYRNQSDALREAARAFRLDLWRSQKWRPEVWVEKEALSGVVEGICNQLRVDYFACRGYNSQSEQWRAAQRFAGYIRRGQTPVVFHLGDHDPSGLDMTRDNADRLALFTGIPIQVTRLGLNWGQIQELDPPPNPAKMTDSRAVDYVRKYGDQSWELDALSPTYIRQLISGAVSRLRDEDTWSSDLAEEVEQRRALDDLAEELEADAGL